MMIKKQKNKEKVFNSIGYAKVKVNKMLVMIEQDDDVMTIIHDSEAARRALKRVDSMVIKEHIEKVAYGQQSHAGKGTAQELLSLLKFWLD